MDGSAWYFTVLASWLRSFSKTADTTDAVTLIDDKRSAMVTVQMGHTLAAHIVAMAMERGGERLV